MDRIILASASPRRKQLLEWAEIKFDIIPSDADEMVPDKLPVSEIPVFLASQKAAIVRKKTTPDRIILAADTIVVLDQQMLGKPLDRSDAIRMLLLLSGKVQKAHSQITASNAASGKSRCSASPSVKETRWATCSAAARAPASRTWRAPRSTPTT